MVSKTAFIFLLFMLPAVLSSAVTHGQIKLPPHKFSASLDPGHSNSQIRVIVKPLVYTQQELMDMAKVLARRYAEGTQQDRYLVQFFSDQFSLKGWDGTSRLRELDWPFWLCRIVVQPDSNGILQADFFELAVDFRTGKPRADVLKNS